MAKKKEEPIPSVKHFVKPHLKVTKSSVKKMKVSCQQCINVICKQVFVKVAESGLLHIGTTSTCMCLFHSFVLSKLFEIGRFFRNIFETLICHVLSWELVIGLMLYVFYCTLSYFFLHEKRDSIKYLLNHMLVFCNISFISKYGILILQANFKAHNLAKYQRCMLLHCLKLTTYPFLH